MANKTVAVQLVRDELKIRGLTASRNKEKALHSRATRLVREHGQEPSLAVKNAVAKAYCSHFASLASAARPVKTERGLFQSDEQVSDDQSTPHAEGQPLGVAEVRFSNSESQGRKLRIVGGVGRFKVAVNPAEPVADYSHKFTLSPASSPRIDSPPSTAISYSENRQGIERPVGKGDSESVARKKKGSDFDMFLAVVFGSLSIAATYLLVRAGMVVFGSTTEGIVQSVLLEASIPIIHTLRFSEPLARFAKNALIVAMIACSILVVHTSVDVKSFEAADAKFGFSTNAQTLNRSAMKLEVEQDKQVKKQTSFVTKTKQTLDKVMESNNAVLEIYKISGFKKASEHQRYSSLAMQVVLIVLNLIFFGQFIVRVKQIL